MASLVRRRPAALRRRDDRTRVLAALGGRGLARGGPGLAGAPGRGGADLGLRRPHAAVARGRASLAAALPAPRRSGSYPPASTPRPARVASWSRVRIGAPRR